MARVTFQRQTQKGKPRGSFPLRPRRVLLFQRRENPPPGHRTGVNGLIWVMKFRFLPLSASFDPLNPP